MVNRIKKIGKEVELQKVLRDLMVLKRHLKLIHLKLVLQ